MPNSGRPPRSPASAPVMIPGYSCRGTQSSSGWVRHRNIDLTAGAWYKDKARFSMPFVLITGDSCVLSGLFSARRLLLLRPGRRRGSLVNRGQCAGTAAAVKPAVNYVALGDSYSSGVGAGDYLSSSGSCDRSADAYPEQWAAANSPATFISVACSGATTADVLSQPGIGAERQHNAGQHHDRRQRRGLLQRHGDLRARLDQHVRERGQGRRDVRRRPAAGRARPRCRRSRPTRRTRRSSCSATPTCTTCPSPAPASG